MADAPRLPDPDTTHYAQWAGDRIKYHSVDQIIGYGHQQFNAGREFEAERQAARAPSPPVAAPAGRYVIFTRPGKVPERKGPYPTTALMESSLREIQQAYPDAISMVLVDLPADCWPTSGVEWIDMHGDKRKGRLIAAPQPPRPGTAPLSDEMRSQMIEECGYDYDKRGIFASGFRAAEKHYGIGHPATPTPKDAAAALPPSLLQPATKAPEPRRDANGKSIPADPGRVLRGMS